jgi:hypothetical protein
MESNNKLELIIKTNELEKAEKIDNSIKSLMSSGLSGFALSIARANVASVIRESLSDDMMKGVFEMENKKYGFLTDKTGSEKYTKDVIKDCFIEASMKGVEPTGNQFNIISGKCYITKEGCREILKKNKIQYELFPGFSKKIENGGTVLPVRVEWVNTSGKKEFRELTLSVQGHEKVAEVARKGMAERDAMAWLIDHLTNSPVSVGEVEPKVVEGGYAEEVKTEPEPQQSDITMATPDQQSRFDRYVSAATSYKDVTDRATEVVTNFGLTLNSFNLTKYNEKCKSF